jgi:hypothetical protein
MLRKVFGPVYCREGWRIGNNKELQKLIKGENIVKYVKARRMKWWRFEQNERYKTS